MSDRPPELRNALAGETSPYLKQHAGNPVAWQPWSEQALALARQLDKPILLSIGYSACHWCHVMAHESFEDAEVAAQLNRQFVNIKVDREERPDLDQIYQTAHQMLTGRHGGWPLTLFLDTAGMPFHGGTYFPKTARYGLPGFADLCARVSQAWHAKRGEIAAQHRELQAALNRIGTAQPRAATPPGSTVSDMSALLRARLLGSFDRDAGGFGGAPKFPHTTDLAFLLHRRNDSAANAAAVLTLRKMAEGGIHDQLGGGFCRYSVDEGWQIPHFEKMLYDNGPLLGLYAEAWLLTGEACFRTVAEGIAGWLEREMTAPDGSFYAALDADSEGEEGQYYVWDRADVAALLTPAEMALAERHWGLGRRPNFENRRWHLTVVEALAADEMPLRAAACAKLFAARAQRVRPALDDKLLTSWNALAIAGLCRAARGCQRDDWAQRALTALDAVKSRRWRDGADAADTAPLGRLLATERLSGYLDDYAGLLAAVLEALQTHFRAADLHFAQALADALLARFEDIEHGGFYFTAHDHERLIQRPKPGHDNALPAGNGIAALALLRLGHLLGEVRYLAAAERTVAFFQPQLQHSVAGMASLVAAAAELSVPPAIVILRGPPDEVAEWRRQIVRRPTLAWAGPSMILALPNTTAAPAAALAKPASAHVNAWVCCGVSCLAPINDFARLEAVLKSGEFR